MAATSVDCCVLVSLPKIVDARGALSFAEGEVQVPFAIRRIFYLYDLPPGAARGGHAHRACHQFFIALAGSFEVQCNDGRDRRSERLTSPDAGLHVPPGIWVDLSDFDAGSICLVLASDRFNEGDYIRSWDAFNAYRHDRDG